jgi:hypothetical protein
MSGTRTALTAVTCGVAIAACGSSDKTSTNASRGDPGLRFAQCMRAHGVSNFPDPSPGGDLEIGSNSGVNPRSPAFQSAQRSCRSLLPFKGGPPAMTAAERAAALRFAECMRANGQPDFPDPGSPAAGGSHLVLVLRGMVFAPGRGIDPKSPAFRQSASRCGVRLPT